MRVSKRLQYYVRIQQYSWQLHMNRVIFWVFINLWCYLCSSSIFSCNSRLECLCHSPTSKQLLRSSPIIGVDKHEFNWAQAHSVQQKAQANLTVALCHFEALIPGLWERHVYDEGTEHYNTDLPDRRYDFVMLLRLTLLVFILSRKAISPRCFESKAIYGLWKKY